MKKIILLVTIFLVACSTTSTPMLLPTATIDAVYVSPSGNDAASGDISNPYRTVSKAISSAPLGSVIYLRAGSYPQINITKSGVQIVGYQDEYPVVKGVKCYRANNVVVSRIEVIGAVGGNYTGAIFFDQCNNGLISENKVHDNITPTTSGIVAKGNENQILYNEVYGNFYCGIRISGPSSGTEIGMNTVYNHVLAKGDSDGIELAVSTVTNSHVHDNLIYGNSDDGVDTWVSPSNLIENNVSHHNGGAGDGNGFKLGGGANGGFNMVAGNVSYSNEGSGFTSNGNGNYYTRNIAYDNGEYGFVDSWRTSGSVYKSSFVDNISYGNVLKNFGIDNRYILQFVGNSETPLLTPTFVVTVLPRTGTPSPTLRPTSTLVPTGTPRCETTEILDRIVTVCEK